MPNLPYRTFHTERASLSSAFDAKRGALPAVNFASSIPLALRALERPREQVVAA